jgi:hypothetical protein
MHFRLSEPLTPFCGTPGFRKTQFEKHCSIPCKHRISSQHPRRYPRTCKQNVSTYSDMTIMCYSHILLNNKSCHRGENSHSKAIAQSPTQETILVPWTFLKQRKTAHRGIRWPEIEPNCQMKTPKRNGVHQCPPTAAIPEITGCMRLDDVRQKLNKTRYDCHTI